jgi:hypothetical protein
VHYHLLGLVTVAAMVTIGAVLGTASLIPCRGGMTRIAVGAWLLELYVGQPPPVYPNPACPGQPPLALQLGQVVCLAATLIGALTVLAALWRQPTDRLRVRFARDVTVVTGLDSLAIALLRRLAQTRNPRNIVVIEPDEGHPLLQEARLTGARIIIGNPASERLLGLIISGRRRCALSYLYALRSDVQENEDVLGATARILGRYRPDPERQPHMVARIDDPRHADSWRGDHSGTPNTWFEDALSPAELTACTLVNRILRSGVRQVALCGDSTLTMTVLLELARQAWEQAELVKAAAIGRAAARAASICDGTQPDGVHLPGPALLPVERLILMDLRAADILREYMASAPRAILDSAPEIEPRPVAWRDHLLATMDALAPADAHASAVIIADRLLEASLHEAGRVARLHPHTPIFVQVASREGTDGAVFDSLRPFQQGLLVDGNVPEDAWTRVARHWHECFRLRHPVAPGDPKMYGRRPWDELDQFIRQDNILQLRSILSAVAARGRQWVPARMVPRGSFIELTDTDLEEIACAEHTRWYQRRLAAGWTAGDGQGGAGVTAKGPSLSNAAVVPWPQLPPGKRTELRESVRSQLAQLEDVGYVAIVPSGGPAQAARFRRSAEPLDGEPWSHMGICSAWRAGESLVIRTLEGRATANPGDWVIEGALGERWPVSEARFKSAYRPRDNSDAPC